MKKSTYQTLGLNRNSTKEDIKKAYKRLIREFTPEQNPEKFAEIRNAYDVLTNEEYFTNFFRDDLPFYELNINNTQNIEFDKLKYLKSIFETPFELLHEIKD